MRKIIILVLCIVLIVLVSLLTVSYLKISENKKIESIKISLNQLLTDKMYKEAFDLINDDNEKFSEILYEEINAYTIVLSGNARENLSLDELILFKEAATIDYLLIDNTIEEIQTEKSRLELSAENFEYAVSQYNKRNFKEAQKYFETVSENDYDFDYAAEYLADIEQRNISWDNNVVGKNSYINAITCDDEYMYIPFIIDGVDGICKITKEGKFADFFPLSVEAGKLLISSINIVGDYIYFIAGENVGSGFAFDNPYCIYEMKTDGSNLNVAAYGNFTDLYIDKDRIYAISRDMGLVELDRNFDLQNVIAEGIISEFSAADNGIYYVVQESYRYDNTSSLYLFESGESKHIASKEYLHYYQFSNFYIKYWKGNSLFEVLEYGNAEQKTRVRNSDMYKMYGVVEGKILYSCNGSLGREILYVYQIDNGATIQLVDSKAIIDYSIRGILYEEDKLIIEKNNKLFLSNITVDNLVEVEDIRYDMEKAEINNNIIQHLQSTDIYTANSDEEVISVIYDKQNWHYKDDKLNITIEKRYVEEYDCNVYITHIFTTDYSLFNAGNAKESPTSTTAFKASSISDKFKAIYAQNTDTFLDDRNTDRGIIIREGKVVRVNLLYDMLAYFDDGRMEIYRSEDGVTGQKLVDDGAVLSFSFGPVLVEDYNVVKECLNVKLANRNPRSAIGYVEPGHYVMVACDGRDDDVSRGLNMIQLARIFEEEGCELAYNLDGGMTTAVLFMGTYITNRPAYSSGSEWFFYRSVAEILYVGTSEASPVDLSPYTYDYSYFTNNIR